MATAWLAMLLLLVIGLVRGKPPFTIGPLAAVAAFLVLAAGQWAAVQVWRERGWALVVLGLVALATAAVVVGPMLVGLQTAPSVSRFRFLSANGFILICSLWWASAVVSQFVKPRSAP